MNISIFGLGYVGCVSLGCLASKGHKVIGVDVNINKVSLINQGKPTIIEKEIDFLIEKGVSQNLISATNDFKFAIQNSEIAIISVGTPSSITGHLNLDYIYKVAQEIGIALTEKREFFIVVIRSTVLPGTNEKVGEIIESYSGKKRNIDFTVVSNPEFMREGNAVYDYFNPPVTVLGSDNKYALDIMEELYKVINSPVIKVDIEIAELIKYVNNSFHALKITFANEIGSICKKLSIDSHELMDIFVLDTYLNLSPAYLKPGYAFGGSCLPKDLKGLNTIAHDNYLKTPLISSIHESNQNHKLSAIKLIESKNRRNLGIIGLSFKAGTDDLRYSPMVELAEYFLGKGYNITIYDKNVSLSKLTGANKEYIDNHIPHLSKIIYDDILYVIDNSEIVVIAHKMDNADSIIEKYPDKYFIDLVRITDNSYSNYEGICW